MGIQPFAIDKKCHPFVRGPATYQHIATGMTSLYFRGIQNSHQQNRQKDPDKQGFHKLSG
jgi:hypothetical protein